MITHRTQVRVYYKDTDAGGVVYYTRYAEFMEVGRTELFRHLGLTAARLAEEFGILCPVVELNVKYRRSARYDDLLTIETSITQITGVRLFFASRILDEAGGVLAEGSTINCCVDGKALRPVKMPEVLMGVLGEGS